ncbi:hypothetical protein GGX14DRAFT_392556 [Mycena pura]|uniref:Uncharacterized protein n=1 Tax=Mycena pura TaxID=153505 RepID=A0AAD6VN63_9AGAR|nr:hypothetical protein GGX14DRAFT_392556 [Mycena pura]
MAPRKSHMCKCALRPFPHEVPANEWLAHQADIERAAQHIPGSWIDSSSVDEETNYITLQTARIVLSDSSDYSQPVVVDPQTLIADLQQSTGKFANQRPRKKQVAPQMRSARVLSVLASDVEGAIRSLQTRPSDPSALWAKADNARKQISVVALSLQDHQDSSLKESVVSELRKLERELDSFQSSLPPDTRPLFYDSGKC